MQRLYRKRDPRDATRLLPNWYTTIDGKAVSTGCRNRRAAEARSAALERAATAPRDAPPSPTLHAALERAVADRRQRGRAAGTLHMWGVKCGALLRVLGRDTPISTIDAAKIDDYISARREPAADEEPAAAATIAKEIGCLLVALRIAKRRGEYPHELDAVRPVEMHRESKPRTRALSPEELRLLLADLLNDKLPQRRRSMAERAGQVAFIVATSARWGEAERARREDVAGGFVLLRGTKTEGALRTVPVLPTTAPLLRIALEHGGDGLLFTPWGNVRRDLHEACERAGIPPCSPNDLRRTTATWLRNAGVAPQLIAVVLGHRDGRMVERVYGRMSPEALRDELLLKVGGVVPLLGAGKAAPRPAARKKRTG